MTKLEVLCPLEVSHYMVSSPIVNVMTLVSWFAKSIQMHAAIQKLKNVLFLCCICIAIMGRGSRPICRVGPKTPQNKMAATVG